MKPATVLLFPASANYCDHGISLANPCRHCDRLYTLRLIRHALLILIPMWSIFGLLSIWGLR